MSCVIDFGIPRWCNDGKAGVKIAYWTKTSNIASMSVNPSGQVTSLTMNSGKSLYALDFGKENGLFNEDMTFGGTTGTNLWAQVFSFNYKKLGLEQRHKIQAAANAGHDLTFVLRDANDNLILMGETGAALTGDATTSGKVSGENNGSTLTFTSNEGRKALYVSASVFASLPIVSS